MLNITHFFILEISEEFKNIFMSCLFLSGCLEVIFSLSIHSPEQASLVKVDHLVVIIIIETMQIKCLTQGLNILTPPRIEPAPTYH